MEKTFKYQNELIIRPIPGLEDTGARFLEWVEPLLSADEFEKTTKITERFLAAEGQGPKLQQALIDWVKTENLVNWTEPLWYDIYLDSRVPLPINSNVFYLLEDMPEIVAASQSAAATALTLTVLNFKELIDSETLPVETQRGEPLCMKQYTNLFMTSRIPKPGKDEFFKTQNSRHIAVLNRGHIFSVDVLTPDGEIKPFNRIEATLRQILEETELESDEKVGLLTTLDRDQWADARGEMENYSESNRKLLHAIDSAIFVLCIDNLAPTTKEECLAHFLHANGRNRWFDKALQFIVTKNNKIGLNLEHTGFDGSVITNMNKYIYNNIQSYLGDILDGDLARRERNDFVLPDSIREVIKKRDCELDQYAADFSIKVVRFEKFGNGLVKTFKVSPDAFVQLAMQLAQYKLFGYCHSQYEAVMARKYLFGRIEVSHCISNESLAFVKSMMDESVDDAKRIDLLRTAAGKQVSRLAQCREGQGIDSHLFALLKMANIHGEKLGITGIPEFFQDAGYQKLTHSTICTSTTAAQGVDLVGYGPVVEAGFAIRYLKDNDSFTFNMVARTKIKAQLERLALLIEESLQEMAELMAKATNQEA